MEVGNRKLGGGNKIGELENDADLLVSDGSDEDESGEDGWLKNAHDARWAKKVCFVTASHTEIRAFKMPHDRKDFARMLNVAYVGISPKNHGARVPLRGIGFSRKTFRTSPSGARSVY